MSTLLYIESSPRKERSASIEVAHTFLDCYRAAHPTDIIDTLDVWSTPLPEFNGAALEAKYAGIEGATLSTEQATAWATIRALADRFIRADKFLISVPMWNPPAQGVISANTETDPETGLSISQVCYFDGDNRSAKWRFDCLWDNANMYREMACVIQS